MYCCVGNGTVGAALSDIVARGTDQGWDSRSLALFEAALRSMPPSSGLQELREDLRWPTQDPARIGSDLPAMLARLGYTRKSDNKHIRMEPPEGLLGAHPVTVPKTPADHRSGENMRAQIERDLGLKRLSQRNLDNPTRLSAAGAPPSPFPLAPAPMPR